MSQAEKNNNEVKESCPKIYLLDNGKVYCSEVHCQCSLKETINACRQKDDEDIEVVITPKIKLKAVENLLSKLRNTGYKHISLSFSTLMS